VEDIHEIHIWTITSGVYALSAHLKITRPMVSQSSDITILVNKILASEFNITHTTLQLECENCPTVWNAICRRKNENDFEGKDENLSGRDWMN